MKNKIIKKMLSLMTVCCIALSMGTICVSAESTAATLSTGGDWDIMPYTMYLASGEITYQKPNATTMRVMVTTRANSKVSSIYHDVVIYKNGTLVYSGRSSESDTSILVSHQDFPASEGDFYSTYVTHYVSKNGYTEHCDTHHDQVFY